MCVILVCVDKKPSYNTVHQCFRENPDGFGIAWCENEKIKYKKGITTVDKIYEQIQAVELPFTCHFRKASVGGYSRYLHHPFEITDKSELKLEGECDRILFHNGTFPYWRATLEAAQLTIPKENINGAMVEEPMSDSRSIAMVLAKLGGPSDKYEILRHIGDHFIVFDAKDNKIWMYGDFPLEDGINFSNLKWKTYHHQTSYIGYHSQPQPVGYGYQQSNLPQQTKYSGEYSSVLYRYPDDYYKLSRKEKRKYREKLRIEKIKTQLETFNKDEALAREIAEIEARNKKQTQKIHEIPLGGAGEKDYSFLCDC